MDNREVDSGFAALFIRDFRTHLGITQEQIVSKIKKNDINIDLSTYSRMETGKTKISQKFFNEFCSIFNIPFCFVLSPSQQDLINQAYSSLIQKFLYRPYELPDSMPSLNEEEIIFLNSRERFSFILIKAAINYIEKNTELSMELLIRLEEIIKTDSIFDTSALPNQLKAMAYYVIALKLIGDEKSMATAQYLRKAQHFISVSTDIRLAMLIDYQLLRCVEFWNSFEEAISSCDRLTNQFNSIQCYSRAWDTENLKTIYLNCAGQFKTADELQNRLLEYSIIMQDKRGMKISLDNLIWGAAASGNNKKLLEYLNQAKSLFPDDTEVNLYYPFYLYRSGEAFRALPLIRELQKTEQAIEDSKFLILLEAKITMESYFVKRAIHFINYVHKLHYSEMVWWGFELLSDYYRDRNDHEMAMKAGQLLVNYMRTSQLPENFRDLFSKLK